MQDGPKRQAGRGSPSTPAPGLPWPCTPNNRQPRAETATTARVPLHPRAVVALALAWKVTAITSRAGPPPPPPGPLSPPALLAVPPASVPGGPFGPPGASWGRCLSPLWFALRSPAATSAVRPRAPGVKSALSSETIAPGSHRGGPGPGADPGGSVEHARARPGGAVTRPRGRVTPTPHGLTSAATGRTTARRRRVAPPPGPHSPPLAAHLAQRLGPSPPRARP